MEPLSTILVTAYAKAPQGTSMYEVYKYSGLILEINKDNHEIVDSEFTFVTELAQNYFKKMLKGHNLIYNTDDIINIVNEHYVAPSSSSIIVCLKSAKKRYLEHIEKN